MTNDDSTVRNTLDSTKPAGISPNATELSGIVKEGWRRSGRVDLRQALERHPEVLSHRSLFLDLVQAELKALAERGEACSPEEYCRRFPLLGEDLLRSVHRCVEVELLLAGVPDLMALLADAPWPEPGECFAGFDLVEEIGRGAASRVYLSRQEAIGNREVVLKVTRRAQNEASLLGRLSHPGVVPIHSTGFDERSALGWICMPYLGRRTLEELIPAVPSPGPVRPTGAARSAASRPNAIPLAGPVDRTLRLYAQVAEALKHVHSASLVHGDLKPSNVLWSDEGEALLIDFSLAKEVDAEAGLVGGTLPYMAPEQLAVLAGGEESGRCRVTPRTEAFSFGVMLFESLTGRRPVELVLHGMDLVEASQALLDGYTRPPARSVINGDRRIATLLNQLLAMDPEDRPESFAATQQNLMSLMRPAARLGRFARRRPLLTMGAAAAVSAVVATALAIVPASREATRLRAAEAYFDQGRFNEAAELLQAHVSERPSDGASQNSLAESLLGAGEPRRAAEHFLAAWRLDGDPLQAAMAGYCHNLAGQHAFAERMYLEAKKQGLDSAAVNHNLGASLVNLLSSSFDDRGSEKAGAHLLRAYQQAPRNETVRITMLRHSALASESPTRMRPAYPVEITSIPSESAGVEFCMLAILHLHQRGARNRELEAYGRDLLVRLETLVGSENLHAYLVQEVLAPYRRLGHSPPATRLALGDPPAPPPQFLRPGSLISSLP